MKADAVRDVVRCCREWFVTVPSGVGSLVSSKAVFI